MSATAANLEDATVTVAERRSAASAAKALEAGHARNTQIKRECLSSLEANDRAVRTATALGEKPTAVQPSAAEMEELRRDLDVAEQVARALAARSKAAETAHITASRAHRSAHSQHLQANVLNPARAEVAAAFDQLRAAGVRLMAVHNVIYRNLDDRPPLPNSVLDLHGPMAELLSVLQRMDWASYPYSIRPDWLPLHGRFFPDELPGVAEQVAEMLAQAEQVPS